MIQIESQEDDIESSFCESVNKELLCFYSPYYTAAIKGGFSERHKDLFTLELTGTQTQLFVEWLYTGRCEYQPYKQFTLDDLYALYVFADLTDIIALRRSIMTSLAKSFCRRPTPGDMGRLVSQLPSDSGLRVCLLEQVMAERMIHERRKKEVPWDWEERGYLPEDFPEDFYNQLINGHLEYGEDFRFPGSIGLCNYHEHEDGEEWRMSKRDGLCSRIHSADDVHKLAPGTSLGAVRENLDSSISETQARTIEFQRKEIRQHIPSYSSKISSGDRSAGQPGKREKTMAESSMGLWRSGTYHAATCRLKKQFLRS